MSWADRFDVTALNLPEHARNPIHTDEGAQAAGFPRALVAGVSVYAYMAHLPVVALGESWIAGGGAEVLFRSPVFDHDRLACVPVTDDEGDHVRAEVDGQLRSTARVWASGAARGQVRPGDVLEPLELELTDEWVTYATRLGDALAVFEDGGIVHPAAWPALANDVVHAQIRRGSWVHTRSHIQHHGVARLGDDVVVRSVVVKRWDTHHGDWAVLDVNIDGPSGPLATIEHEAIIAARSV